MGGAECSERSMSMGREQTIIRIKIESPTSDFWVEVNKESDKVEDLVKVIKQAWGNEYMTLHYSNNNDSAEPETMMMMNKDHLLAAYNLTHGSVVKVRVFADAP